MEAAQTVSKKRYSKAGEELRKGEYEQKNGYFKYRIKVDGHQRSVSASNLEKLRMLEPELDAGRYVAYSHRNGSVGASGARLTKSGKELHKGEYELAEGRFRYEYYDSNGKKRTLSAKTLSKLRKKERDIGKPKSPVVRKDPNDVVLGTREYYTCGRYVFTYFDDCGNRRGITSSNLEDLRKREIPIKAGQFPELHKRRDRKNSPLKKHEYLRSNGMYGYDERSSEKQIQVYAPTLPKLRRKVRNIKNGHPELNYIHISSKGETLYRRENEKDGTYTYSYKTGTRFTTVSAQSLERLREKEKNINEGHPEKNRERYSSKGELLQWREVEDSKDRGYYASCWDAKQNKYVHFHAKTLEELRTRRAQIEIEGYQPRILIRESSDGETLNVREWEGSDGKFHYRYKDKNKWKSITGYNLKDLREKISNIEAGHPEWNRPNYTKDGQKLRRSEEELKDGRIASTIEVDGRECVLLAPDLESLREYKEYLYRGMKPEEERNNNYTVYQYFQLIFKDRKEKLKFTTYARYMEMAERYLADSCVGNTYLEEVSRKQIDDFVIGIAKSIKERNPDNTGVPTANSILGILAQLYDFAIDDGLVDRSPTRRSRLKDEIKTTLRCRSLDEDQQELLRKYIKGEYFEPHILFMLETGVRFAELVGLRWADIDLEKEVIFIRRNLISLRFEDQSFTYTDTPKTQASVRTIPLTRNIRKILDLVKERCSACSFEVDGFSDFVFTNKSGRLLVNSKMNGIIKKYVKKAKKDNNDIPNFGCHVLRHTFATNAARIGVDMIVTKALMGHAQIETTMNIYMEVQPDMLQVGSEKLCAYYERRYGERGNLDAVVKKYEQGGVSAISVVVQMGKRYGISMDQIRDDLMEQFGMDSSLAADVVKGFWYC